MSGISGESCLHLDTTLTADPDGRFRGSIPEHWRAAGGAHGGYLTALVLRGLLLAVADESRVPLTLTMQFLRPAGFGPALVEVGVERVGRSLTSASARLTQDDQSVVLALATFAAELRGVEYDELPMPRVEPPWPDGRSLISEQAPRFARNLVLQPRFGRPFQSREDPMVAGGWTGLREGKSLDPLALALFCDAWFPPPYVRLDRFVPSPTVALTIYFRARLPHPAAHEDDLCLARFETQLVHDGCFERHGAIWAKDGTVLAQSHQLQLLLTDQ